jgi:hypothetical protein
LREVTCKFVSVGGVSVTICSISDADDDYDRMIDEFTDKFTHETDSMVPEQEIRETPGEDYTQRRAQESKRA